MNLKKKLGPKNFYYPTLTILAGANVNGKPNYEAIAWGGIMGMRTIYIASSKSHYTNRGINENKAFSVNIPSVNLIKKTDFCGLHSGKNTDKSNIFESFYGVLGNAPMISECSINMECELAEILIREDHEIFIGKIRETYCDVEFMTNGKADLVKIQPVLFSFHDSTYWKIGECFAKSWNIGKEAK
jgi:flavin reductase (DIM6/NTAB) family NADH-FMN oxidoreductase RutF